ncbi:hypothetical protein B0T16DRAFT_415474 [Cercophora newfieldiana]|uniref:Uncharacterized protein n=1 Tax=Cercophora newfieldiana TaxID=92897 RepID=A0AA40CLS3_9PEZI|nr:hypothetical protein B0T16DRAFT_415474 [Cercophora newfieldiana]
MHSITIASIMVAAATLTTAAPAVQRRANTKFYNCSFNGFRGDCSVDPCAISWCPDYNPNTYEPAQPVIEAPKPVDPAPVAKYYVCASNGFKGYCTTDPCYQPWCPDGPNGAEPPTGTPQEPEKAPEPVPEVKKTPSQWYVCASNGFAGMCSVDACNVAWCPDYKPKTYEPVSVTVSKRDSTVCVAGTGYFQSCSNGFRGCCRGDACGSTTGWCADYKPWTYEPVTKVETVPVPVPAPVEVPVSVPADCAPGTGFYQVCGNGFKGCCKSDACTLGYCPY